MKPLRGQRVVDLTQNVAGPYCTQVLADLGAEVLKIERPGAGDDTRHWSPRLAEGLSPTYATFNRGKQSLALDIDHAQGPALLRRLLRSDDILVHSLKPGSAERRGLGHEALAQDFPRLIYCAISAFGNHGPLAALPGYDPLIQAYAGILSVNGHEGTAPARVGVSLVDMGTAMWSVIGILAAVAQRHGSGRGTRVDTSLLETGLAWMTNPIANFSASGKLPRRMGSATAMLAPYEVFQSADAWVFIGCGADRMFRKLATALDHESWVADDRFATNAGRVAHRDALHETMEAVTRTLPTAGVVQRLRAAGVPVSGVNHLGQVLDDEQVRCLALHQPLPVPADPGQAQQLQAVGLPIRFDQQREFNAHLSARVGQDSRALLLQAGLDETEIQALADSGAIALG